jgi:hypothetical protein
MAGWITLLLECLAAWFLLSVVTGALVGRALAVAAAQRSSVRPRLELVRDR